VELGVRELTDDQWAAVAAAIAAKAGHAAALLAGELQTEVLDDVASVGVHLLPEAGELVPTCTCADWADPCKHAAAVCYLVADVLDDDPFELFHLRGRDRRTLLAEVRAARRASAVDDPWSAVADRVDDDGDPAAGVAARDAYARPQPSATDIWALDVVHPPEHPGTPARAAVAPPEGSGLATDQLHRIAVDAAHRAWGLAIGATSSGLDLTLDEDLGRIAATVLGTPAFATLSDRSGVGRAELAALGIAWEHGEREGVTVTSATWDPPADWLDEGRRALRGHDLDDVDDDDIEDDPGRGAGREPARRVGWRVSTEANRVSGRGIELRVGPSGLWYRFVESRGAWQLDGPPSPDPAVLVDEL
jgi:hypothetical protein